jgi:hypothetical protein
MTKTDSNVELAKLQNDILEHLGLSQENVIFEFVSVENKVRLDLITINPKHQQSFLFHQEVGVDKVDAAHKMLDYVRSYKEKENSYTIQWMKRGDLELQTSYFRANNVYGALDKLNYGRDMNTITVYSVVLNPVS